MLLCWLLLVNVANVWAQTWCNKNYMSTEPVVPPGGEFPIPETVSSPLLALRCGQAVRPYLPEDTINSDKSFVSILVDSPVTFSKISGAVPVGLGPTTPKALQVTVSVNGKKLTTGSVPLNATKHPLPFSLTSLKPQKEAYTLTCTATLGKQVFKATSLLTFLPPPPPEIGSVTKMDMRTGALLARPANGKGGSYSPVFPIGFYTNSDGYLLQNVSVVAELKSQGFNVIHPVPAFSNQTAFEEVLDAMVEHGMYLMYDMRGTYMDPASVTAQVNQIKSRPNLLLWYTADEPDGTSDPLNATALSSNLITSLDGGDGLGGAGYHPVSLVLNCENYEFTAYASGADILLQDTYMIGNNVTFSSQWGTVCTPDYGDCGCDNCKGTFQDISTRMDEFAERIFINGWEIQKAVWTVPQAFGNETYWKRYPTGQEFVVQSIVGINHGGLGVIPWDDPTTPDIKSSASTLALALPKLTPFILNPASSFRQILTQSLVDIGIWTVGSQTLVLATNTKYEATSIRFADLGVKGTVSQALDSGASLSSDARTFSLTPVGSGAFIVKH